MNDISVDVERLLLTCFRMPSVQTMMARKTSITNAFVNALLPVVKPSVAEIAEALRILGMTPEAVHCAYCGDKASEWDHLRPLVVGRRPTGYISEIGNLVPSCGKCNQSKGNKDWEAWMAGSAPRAPGRRGVADLQVRIERLREFARWRPVEPIRFEGILGADTYADYWARLDRAMQYMSECQGIADALKARVTESHRPGGAAPARGAVLKDRSGRARPKRKK